MTAIYELDGVGRSYGNVHAVEDVSLTVEPGELLAVEGPSGSGKTTLLQLLGALDRPTAGTIRFEGGDLRDRSDAELARLRLHTIGFVFQQFNLIPTLNARQNVEVAIAPTGVRGRERRERALAGLEAVGLAERAGHLPSQLSGGEQQRVAIARALANEPDVLLADEPTGNLDTATGREIVALLERLNAERGVTVLLVTHDPAIAGAASRLVRMSDGRVVQDGHEALRPAG